MICRKKDSSANGCGTDSANYTGRLAYELPTDGLLAGFNRAARGYAVSTVLALFE